MHTIFHHRIHKQISTATTCTTIILPKRIKGEKVTQLIRVGLTRHFNYIFLMMLSAGSDNDNTHNIKK